MFYEFKSAINGLHKLVTIAYGYNRITLAMLSSLRNLMKKTKSHETS